MNIVFDLGGVIVTWEPEAIVAKAFTDPDVRSKVLREIVRHPDWIELDRGTLSREDAIERGARRTGLPEGRVEYFMRQVPPALTPISGTVDLLYRLKSKGHTLFCMSNMHFPTIEYLEKTLTIWGLFKGTAISCRLHSCKPEPAIYTYLLETYGLEERDTVFIDDMEENLITASRVGMATIKFENPAQCEMDLQALGCLDER